MKALGSVLALRRLKILLEQTKYLRISYKGSQDCSFSSQSARQRIMDLSCGKAGSQMWRKVEPITK